MTVQRWAQQENMQNEFNQSLFSLIVASVFSWVGSLSAPDNVQGQFRLRIFIWLVLGVILFAYSVFQKRSIQHAYKFHLLIFLQALPIAVLLEISMSTIVAITQFSGWSLVLFIAINVLVILIGAVAQFQLSREQFIASKDHNINSGRLNLIDGWWNLEANLHFAHPSEERKKQQWAKNVRRLSPLVTAFGFMVARAIEGDMQSLFIAFGGYILGYIISVLVSAKHLAIALQLKTWEKEYEMDIKI